MLTFIAIGGVLLLFLLSKKKKKKKKKDSGGEVPENKDGVGRDGSTPGTPIAPPTGPMPSPVESTSGISTTT